MLLICFRCVRAQSWLVSGGFLHGKMTQQILEDRFGAYLLETIAAFNEERLRSSAGVLKLSSIGGIIGETDINDTLQALCGSNGTPGELQVGLLVVYVTNYGL